MTLKVTVHCSGVTCCPAHRSS